MLRSILQPIIVAWLYLRMTNFPFKTMGVALVLAFIGGYFLRGML